jgi:hypothetical protein
MRARGSLDNRGCMLILSFIVKLLSKVTSEIRSIETKCNNIFFVE